MAAKRSLAGEFSKKVGDISNKVTEVRAFVETILDFSDQDLDETKHPKTLLSMLEAVSYTHLTLPTIYSV